MKTCIHTVILNELDEYLKVWLDHHTKMVDHIFIFEDIGSWSHKHITDQYDNVTLQSVFDIFEHIERKNDIIKRKKENKTRQGEYLIFGLLKIQRLLEYDWCFTLDIDEFITLQEPYKAISSVLSEFQDYDSILLQWMNFGASGHIYKPNYGDMDYREFYTQRGVDSKMDEFFKINTKVAWNLNKLTREKIGGIHCGNGNWVKTNFIKDRKNICYDKIYLKHYVTKSWEEYLWKLYIRGMHCYNRHRSDNDFFQINPDMMDKYDECMEIKNKILNV